MILQTLARIRDSWLLKSYIRQGLKLGRDVRVIGRPDFGSEPYLIEVGDHVTISSDVSFVTHDGASWVFRHLPEYEHLQRYGRIVIRDNCFIGTKSIIMPDVCIGPNAVVGAGAVVTRSVPANTVVAGAPARVISSYDEFVAAMAARCRVYPPEIVARPAELRRVLLETIGYPDEASPQEPFAWQVGARRR